MSRRRKTSGRSRIPRSSLADMRAEFEAEFDRVISDDDNYRKLTRKILAAQNKLKRITTREVFAVYLDIEQVVNARTDLMLTLITKLAVRRKR